MARVRQGVGQLRGLGQSCPSSQQLAGIVDPTDPCQMLTVPISPGTSTPGNFCMLAGFPFIGMASSAGICQQISGSGLALAALSGVLLIAFVMGGKR